MYGDGKSISWDEALVTVQAKEFIERTNLDKQDPLIHLLEGIHDKFMSMVSEPRQTAGFIRQVKQFYVIFD